MLHSSGQLDKHADAVAVAYLNIGGLETVCRTEICPVNVYPITALVAPFQSDRCTSQAVTRPIIDPKRACGRRHIAENGINVDRIGRKRQQTGRRYRERIVVIASRKQPEQGGCPYHRKPFHLFLIT